MLDLWGRDAALRTSALRVAACYGWGERISAVLMRFIHEAMAKRPLTIRGNGRISVEQIYVRDVAAAVLAALDPGVPGGVFNIGAGATVSLIEMAETVNAVFGNPGGLTVEDPQTGVVDAAFLDVSRAAAELNWRPRYDLRGGLEDLRDTWRARGAA
jgi:nucleoside-diphosphate-sugar epimerase